jgi:hypothetical protein
MSGDIGGQSVQFVHSEWSSSTPTAKVPSTITVSEITNAQVNGAGSNCLDPDLRRHRAFDSELAAVSFQLEILLRRQHLQLNAGANARTVQELQETAIALEDADHRQMFIGDCLIERFQSTPSPVARGVHADHIAVRADAARAQLLDQLPFEFGGNGVLQLLRLIVHLVSFEPEDLGQHALDQVMAIEDAVRDLASCRRERQLPFIGYLDQAVAAESLDRHRDGGRGDAEPPRKGHCFDRFTFGIGFRNRFEIVFFGNGDPHAAYDFLTQPWNHRRQRSFAL